MFVREDVALLLRQQRLGLGQIHRDDFLRGKGGLEAIEDAGHSVVHGWMRANVRLAKGDEKQCDQQDGQSVCRRIRLYH